MIKAEQQVVFSGFVQSTHSLEQRDNPQHYVMAVLSTNITTTTLNIYYTSPVVEMKPNNTTIIIIRKDYNRVSIGVLEYLKYDRETPHADYL